MQAAGIPIPSGASAKKSFTIQPPKNLEDKGTIGVLKLGCCVVSMHVLALTYTQYPPIL